MARKVEVVDYDPAWPGMFEREAALLRKVFAPQLLDLHHIGSTAIPGLRAKPTIDAMLVVRDIHAIDGLSDAMVQNGYHPEGEFGIPGRRYFWKGTPDVHTYHAHAYQAGHPEIVRLLNFRDFLRAHRREALAYEALKQRLAERFTYEPERYSHAKDELIRQLDEKAKSWRAQG